MRKTFIESDLNLKKINKIIADGSLSIVFYLLYFRKEAGKNEK